MLDCKHADKLVTVITHVLFVCPLAEVHDEVVGVESERLSHTQQVCIVVDEAHLFLLKTGLNNPRLRQEDEL